MFQIFNSPFEAVASNLSSSGEISIARISNRWPNLSIVCSFTACISVGWTFLKLSGVRMLVYSILLLLNAAKICNFFRLLVHKQELIFACSLTVVNGVISMLISEL